MTLPVSQDRICNTLLRVKSWQIGQDNPVKLKKHLHQIFLFHFHTKLKIFKKNHRKLWFQNFVWKRSFLLFLKQWLFLPCPKSNQFFCRAAPIDCDIPEVSTRSRYWDFLGIKLFVCLFACSRKVYFAIFSAMPHPILILFFD